MNIQINKINIGIIGDKITGKTNIVNVFNDHKFNKYELPTKGSIKIIKTIKIINFFKLIYIIIIQQSIFFFCVVKSVPLFILIVLFSLIAELFLL